MPMTEQPDSNSKQSEEQPRQRKPHIRPVFGRTKPLSEEERQEMIRLKEESLAEMSAKYEEEARQELLEVLDSSSHLPPQRKKGEAPYRKIPKKRTRDANLVDRPFEKAKPEPALKPVVDFFVPATDDHTRNYKYQTPNPRFTNKKLVHGNDNYLSYDRYLDLFTSHKLQVSIEARGIFNLCDSVIHHRTPASEDYRSAKLWFFLLPALSLLTFFLLPWYGALCVVLGAVLFSVLQTLKFVRSHAQQTIIEVSLIDQSLYVYLAENNLIRAYIQK